MADLLDAILAQLAKSDDPQIAAWAEALLEDGERAQSNEEDSPEPTPDRSTRP
jgi:hypothetical protein